MSTNLTQIEQCTAVVCGICPEATEEQKTQVFEALASIFGVQMTLEETDGLR